MGVLPSKDALYQWVVYGKIGVGKLHGLRQLNAELVFSNLSEVLFGGTRVLNREILMHFSVQYPLSIRWEPVEYYPPKNTPGS